MSFTSVAGALVLMGAAAAVQAGMMQTPQYLMDGRWARWNDDGTRIVYTLDTTYSNFNRPNVFTSNADGSGVTQITFFRGNEAFGQYGSAHGPSYLPGTDTVYWRDDRDGAWYMAYAQDDGSTSRTRTTIAGHYSPIRFNADGTKWTFAYHPNFSSSRIHVGSGTPGSGFGTALTRSGIAEVEWGAGGRADTLVYTRQLLQGGVRNLWLVNADGSGETRLTDDSFGDVANPTFSPDGESLFFAREMGGQWDLWSLEIDTGVLRQWTDDAHQPLWPTISPDGSTLMYTVSFPDESTAVSVYRLYTLDLTYVPGPATPVLAGVMVLGVMRRRRR